MSSFYEKFTDPNITIEYLKNNFKRDAIQYRDAKDRYTDEKTGVKAIFDYTKRTFTFFKPKTFTKNERGKYVIDCNDLDKKQAYVKIEYFFICDACGKHKSYHSLINPCKFVEKSKPTYEIEIPDWLNLNEIEFLNKDENCGFIMKKNFKLE